MLHILEREKERESETWRGERDRRTERCSTKRYTGVIQLSVT